jgi:hypothetical protein
MNATKVSTGSIDCRQPEHDITSTDVLIIGFGLSAMPLIRELEKDGVNYVIVSNGESIWDKLEKHGRLDFDLVSSMQTSLYSFELVNRDANDRYLSSKDYLSFIRHYQTQYDSKLIKDWVTLVENHSSHSIVRTQSGRIFDTKHLVISTAFNRKMNQLLNDFDYASAKNKTIAMTGMGDSFNLMISKLAPYNNRIILITNGFLLLDKLVFYDDTSYTLDQLEYHNVRHVSRLFYRKTVMVGMDFIFMCQKLLKLVSIKNVYCKYPLAFPRRIARMYMNFLPHSPIPNGIIVVKYWPIDSYQKLFDNVSLKQFIKDGYLLNDIVFFLEQGLVQLWPKQETLIDREKQTIRWKDNVVDYDCIVDADYETPNLPEIVANGDGYPTRKYEYVYRHNFMGIVAKQLRNVYFIGFTRPRTGGLNNIIEMQCLFTHKMIVDSRFNHEIYDTIEERVRRYNKYYYPYAKGHSDHLVDYEFYTDDIARLMKINPRLSDCRSIRDFVLYFIFPNDAFKYRQTGPYKVDGVKEMVHQIYKNHNGFSVVINFLLAHALLQLTAYLALIMAYYRHDVPAVALPFLFIFVLLNPVTGFVAVNGIPRNSYLNLVLIAALGPTAYYKTPLIPIASLVVVFALTYAFRYFGWTRPFFNDLKNKLSPKYQDFFRRYCEAFKQVFGETDSPSKQNPTLSRSGLRPSEQGLSAATRVTGSGTRE